MNFKCNGVNTTILSLDETFPIGSIYTSINSENPATYLGGGVWQSFGEGRTLVGVSTSDTSFDTIEKTGGQKTSTELNCGSRGYGLQAGSGSYADRTIVRTGAITGTDERDAQISLLQPYVTVYFWKRTA